MDSADATVQAHISNAPVRHAERIEQLGRRHFQRIGQLQQCQHARYLRAAFERAEMVAMEPID